MFLKSRKKLLLKTLHAQDLQKVKMYRYFLYHGIVIKFDCLRHWNEALEKLFPI